MLGHFATTPDSLNKARKEVDTLLDTQIAASKHMSERHGSPKTELRNHLIYDNFDELKHLGFVMMEALRVMCPVPLTTSYRLNQDSTVRGLRFRTGDDIAINLHGLHKNKKEWQKPKEFHPERFDSDHPMYLTPDGRKRNPMSWSPFNGGKRICFGKTFAEANLKIVSTYMIKYFNMEFVEKDKYSDTHHLP